jgi:hypothetical protein
VDVQRFWTLTPEEVFICLEAHAENIRTSQRLLAWQMAPVLNAWSKDRVTPAKMLGEEDQTALRIPDAPAVLGDGLAKAWCANPKIRP